MIWNTQLAAKDSSMLPVSRSHPHKFCATFIGLCCLRVKKEKKKIAKVYKIFGIKKDFLYDMIEYDILKKDMQVRKETIEMKKKRKKRESIKSKMLSKILTPTILGLVITAILISVLVGSRIQKLQNQTIADSSLNTAYQISEYFTKYMEASRQLGSDAELVALLEQVKPGDPIAQAEQYVSVMTTMTNLHNTDRTNILVSWIADIDSSQCIEDSGYISTIGEWDITTRSWYQQVITEKTTIVTEPYQNSSTGEMVASIITPVFGQDNTVLGVAALDLSLEAVTNKMAEHSLGKKGFFILLTAEGSVMYAKESSLLRNSIQELSIDPIIKTAFASKNYGSYAYQFNGQKQYGYLTSTGESQWVVLSGLPNLEYNSNYYWVVTIILFLFIIVIIILALIISIIAKNIVQPIGQLNQVALKIAEGELDMELRVDSQDEIGEVADSIEKTVIRLKHYINYIDEIAEVLNEIAKGNLVFVLKQNYEGEFGKIKLALEYIATTMKKTIHGINNTAVQVSGGAEQIAQAAQALADGATSQAGAVEELMTTISDISTQVRENAEFAKNAAGSASKVKGMIEQSNQEMKQMVKAMEEISACSDAIRKIIANIEEIADQTTLLSLNASIEAARAGEMGKGFAVVANEVANLSKESAGAVQTSTELIEDSLSSVKRGMDIVSKTAARLSESAMGVMELADKMNELSVIADNQMISLEEVERGIDQIAHVVNDNSAMAEESAASSEELSAQATALNEMIGIFHMD